MSVTGVRVVEFDTYSSARHQLTLRNHQDTGIVRGRMYLLLNFRRYSLGLPTEDGQAELSRVAGYMLRWSPFLVQA